MASVGSAKGDVIDLDFDAKGVSVSDNGKARGRIDDPAFARALLRVWLGENPSQSSLKKALLGNYRRNPQRYGTNLAKELPPGVPTDIQLDGVSTMVTVVGTAAGNMPARPRTSAWASRSATPSWTR